MPEHINPIAPAWTDDDAPELTPELAARAQVTHAGKILHQATGTVTRRGRPPLGGCPKQHVTLRLPADVIAFFKAGGPGWQSRLGQVLTEHAARESSSKVT